VLLLLLLEQALCVSTTVSADKRTAVQLTGSTSVEQNFSHLP
jgi:hypothetical protein